MVMDTHAEFDEEADGGTELKKRMEDLEEQAEDFPKKSARETRTVLTASSGTRTLNWHLSGRDSRNPCARRTREVHKRDKSCHEVELQSRYRGIGGASSIC